MSAFRRTEISRANSWLLKVIKCSETGQSTIRAFIREVGARSAHRYRGRRRKANNNGQGCFSEHLSPPIGKRIAKENTDGGEKHCDESRKNGRDRTTSPYRGGPATRWSQLRRPRP